MYQTLLADPKFHERILDFDRDRAEACRAAGCPDCGGTLHAANYLRKPRGWLIALGEQHDLRFSFCCAVEGCRDRATPPSLRFLGRKVYLATIVILISAMRNGLTERRLGKLAEAIGVDRPDRGALANLVAGDIHLHAVLAGEVGRVHAAG